MEQLKSSHHTRSDRRAHRAPGAVFRVMDRGLRPLRNNAVMGLHRRSSPHEGCGSVAWRKEHGPCGRHSGYWPYAHFSEATPAGSQAQTPASCCAALQTSRRKMVTEADYVDFNISDEFVVGYGLDYEERYRNLADIYVLQLAPEPVSPTVNNQ